LTVVVLIAAAVLPFVALGGPSSASIAEAGYVARAFALAEVPEALASSSPADRVLAAYHGVTSAWSADGNPVLAGRVPMLLAAGLGVILVWLLARQLTKSRITAAVAAGLFGLSPLSITLHRTVDPANLAVPWLLAAILLAALAGRTDLTRPGRILLVGAGAIAALVGLLLAPILLVVLPAFGWYAWEALAPRPRDRIVDAVATVVLAVAWPVTYLVVRSGTGSTGLGFGAENTTLDLLIGPDPVFVVLSVLTALGALSLGRLRIVSATLLALVVLCFFPGSAARVSAAIAAVPFAALVIPGAVEAAWLHWRDVTSGESARLRRLGPAIVVGLLVVLALPIWLVRLGPEVAARSDGDPARAVAGFLNTQVADDESVVVDDATWVVLAREGGDLTGTAPYDAVRSGGSFVPSGLDPTLAVAAEGVRDERLRDLLDRSRPLAAFGPLVIREVPDPAASEQPSAPTEATPGETPPPPAQAGAEPVPAEELERRRAAGADLLRNLKLITEPPAATALEDGQVDPRLLSVLVSAIFSQTIKVADFPVARGEEGTDAARRTAIITEIDGAAVDADGEATEKLVRFLEAQQPTYRPADISVSLTESTMTIRYDAPTPVGLLARGA
jgi:Dolichyl-phosphate-mannose-protein mannosyltransferase